MKTPDDYKFDKRVGALLRQARLDQGIDQMTLAAHVGTAQSAISKVETGRSGVTVWLLRRIARGLGCELKIVLERKNYETT